MIDKKELRYGNLLKHGDSIVTVEEIGDDGINICWMHEMTCWDYDYKNLDPIPLSPEWLEKAGEKYSREDKNWEYEIRAGALKWYFRWNTKWYSELGGIYIDSKIQYVHQLQNLYFDLTGNELQLKTTNTI